MFKSILHNQNAYIEIEYDDTSDDTSDEKLTSHWIVIDDDFEDEVSVETLGRNIHACVSAVIKVYSDRNLNVALNIFKYIDWSAFYYERSFEQEFSYHMDIVGYILLPYKEDLVKYLLLK